MKNNMQWTGRKKIAAGASTLLLAMVLDGCGGGLSSNRAPAVAPVPHASGEVHGGEQPISGATIQLYAVGMTGLKSAATPLLVAPVTTNAYGSFVLTGDWDCTSNTAAYGTNPLLYIVATQGNPGFGNDVNNPAIAAMAAIGPCSSFTSTSFVSINERTTVAAVYALAPFMADYAHIGASGANPIGIVNAFQTANVLADSSTGAVPGPALPSNATAPVAEINTLADILAFCINSTGADGSCSSLFAATTPTAGSAPTNTIAAMLNIAANPGSNVATLYGMYVGAPPFQLALSAAPNDWTIALKFTGGGLNSPAAIAIDASGNAWVANAGGNSVTELSSTGNLLTGAAGYSGSNNLFGAQGIAIDKAGNVWVADTLLSSVVELTVSGGAVQSNTSYTAGGISGPIGIAIDSRNNVWVSNFAGGSVTELTSAGVPIGGSPLTAGQTLQNPIGIEVDSAGNVWVSDNSASVVAEFANNQTLLSRAGDSDAGILAPTGIAADVNGGAIVVDNGSNAVSLFGANGSALASSPVLGGGISQPAAVAIDGQGVAWVANSQTTGSLSQLLIAGGVALSPPTGFGVLNQPAGIAADASGNIWTANAGDNSVSMFVGLSAPVLTPLVTRVDP